MTDLWSREADGQWHLISRHSSYPADMLPRVPATRTPSSHNLMLFSG